MIIIHLSTLDGVFVGDFNILFFSDPATYMRYYQDLWSLNADKLLLSNSNSVLSLKYANSNSFC